jgi:ubiquinone/menaquinone biosynthesis C-methylase UbiE
LTLPDRRKIQASSERFDRWSQTYEKSFTWRFFFNPIHERVAREAGDVSGMSVLDVGCGTGDLLRRLAEAGASQLIGADSSEGMLEVARGLRRGASNIEFIKSSAESLPLGASEFDMVISCVAFHHFPDPKGALSEMARVMKPGGRLLLCDMCGEGISGSLMLAYGRLKAADDHYFDRKTLTKLITSSGLEPTGARRVRLFPPAMLATASKPDWGSRGTV